MIVYFPSYCWCLYIHILSFIMTTVHTTFTVSVENKRSQWILIVKLQLEMIKTCKNGKGSGDYYYSDTSFCTSEKSRRIRKEDRVANWFTSLKISKTIQIPEGLTPNIQKLLQTHVKEGTDISISINITIAKSIQWCWEKLLDLIMMLKFCCSSSNLRIITHFIMSMRTFRVSLLMLILEQL